MKLCIFSDVHGNFRSYEKMMESERNVDCFIFAGDIFGYFYDQAEIIDSMMNLKNLYAVKGNHDLSYLHSGGENPELTDRYGSSCRTVLPERQRSYLESLPEFLETEISGKRLGIFHGGPGDYLNQRIYPDSDMETCINAEALAEKYDYLILGHTHYGFLRREKDLTVINPGSLGQPRDGKGFRYCVLDTDRGLCEFKTVSVPLKPLLDQVRIRDGNHRVCEYLWKKYGGKS